MNTLLSVIPIVVRRFGANWRLQAAVIAGAVLASALMSTTSIYTDAIRDLGLDYAIRTRGPDRINLTVASTSQNSAREAYERDRDFVQNTTRQTLGPLVRAPITTLGRSATFFPTAPGQPVSTADDRRRSHLQFVSELDQHVRIVEGRMPGNGVAPAAGQAPSIEVAIGSETARRLNLRIGDRFDLHPFWTQVAPVQATLVGVIEATDPVEPFWLGQTDLFSFPSANWDTLPFFVTEAAYFDSVAAYLPAMISDFTSLIYLDTSPINSRNAATVRGSIESLQEQLSASIQRTDVRTDLPVVLRDYAEKLFFTRIPLLVLVLQIAGIVLYYLFMVSTMLVERQTGEIALLKSRGATTAQVMQIYAVEGFIILALALLLGPPLAAAMIAVLGHTPPFANLSQDGSLHVRLSAVAYAWAASGAVMAYLALLLPAFSAARSTMVQHRTASARPPQQSAFTRYYLDLVLVGIAGVLFYQLDRRSGLVTEKLFGEQTVDPIMLLTPTFFILTVGIVFLRLFPLALRGFAWVVGHAQGTTMLVSIWQLVRNPVHYSRLVLLLMLATAVGMFAASFGATVNRSYADRASYQAGAPIRLADIRKIDAAGPAAITSAAEQQFGARDSSTVMRLTASQGNNANLVSLDLLGVDPDSFEEVSYFRDDFGGGSLGSLLQPLAEDSTPGAVVDLPADSRWLALRFNPIDLRGRIGLEAELRDANGRYFTYVLGPDAGAELSSGWYMVAADLTRPAGVTFSQYANAPAQGPLQLVSISIRFITRVSAGSGAMLLDDLIVSSDASLPAALSPDRIAADPTKSLRPFVNQTSVDGMDTASDWQPVQGILPTRLRDDVRTSQGGVELRWQPVPGQPATHALQRKQDDSPLAALASEGFLLQSGLQVGDDTVVFSGSTFIEVHIAGSYRLFPTLGDARSDPSMVVNGRRLEEQINFKPQGSLLYANEVWLDPGSDSLTTVRRAQANGSLIAQVVSFSDLRIAQEQDPLVAAGWEGILFLSFASVLVLSAIGFLIYSYLTAQRRTLEFAVLRTMGFSKRQVAAVVGFEQAVVITLGMLAGTAMGLRLGSLMIRYMGLTETGDAVLPPMLLHVSWLTIGSTWLALGAAFLVTIGIVVLLYSRLALHRVLRIGET